MHLLDTDCASHLIRGRSPRLDARIRELPVRQVCISTVTRGELLLGIALKPGADRLAMLVDQFLLRVRSLPWDDAAASAFAQIAAHLQNSGTPIGTMNAMIAAHALALDAVLITSNHRHFSRVPGLRIENIGNE